MSGQKRQLAIIGGGVAGVYAAYHLQHKFDVNIYEASDYLGGHTNTFTVPNGQDEGLPVDTGFIVLNDRTYPLLTEFFSELGVRTRFADMSFSVHCVESNLQYCSRNLDVLFAQRSNLFSLRFLGMLKEIFRFWRLASKDLEDDVLGDQSLRDFLDRHQFSRAIREDFLYPLAAAVWSSGVKSLKDFPAKAFLTFFRNHGWLGYNNQPNWQTVVGGSFTYMKKFQASFNGQIFLNSPVLQVLSLGEGKGQEILTHDGKRRKFDVVVFATHADQVLKLLANPSVDEIQVFEPWNYSNNQTYLHRDSSLMPPMRAVWGSWNYSKSARSSDSVMVTYFMNHLQGLQSVQDYFVSLNPFILPRDELVLAEYQYTHPIFDHNSTRRQQHLRDINGSGQRWYCGSYCGYGFHEDAVKSAALVVEGVLADVGY